MNLAMNLVNVYLIVSHISIWQAAALSPLDCNYPISNGFEGTVEPLIVLRPRPFNGWHDLPFWAAWERHFVCVYTASGVGGFRIWRPQILEYIHNPSLFDRKISAVFQQVQRLAKRLVRGCEKFVPALAYLFCLALPGSCLVRLLFSRSLYMIFLDPPWPHPHLPLLFGSHIYIWNPLQLARA